MMFFEKKKGLKIGILVGIATLMLASIVLAIVLPIAARNSIKDYEGPITVSFETNGGEPVESIVIDSGTKLPENQYPTTFKSGYMFAGWYYDKELTLSYESEELFGDITFYARYVEPYLDENITATLGYCEKDLSFIISSTEELTDSNWEDHIIFSDFGNTHVELLIEKEEDGIYKLYPNGLFVSGGVYSLALVDRKITQFMFAGEENVSGSDVDEYTFQIAMDEVNNIVKTQGTMTVYTQDLIDRTYNVSAYTDEEGRYKEKRVDTLIVEKMPDNLQNGSIIALTDTSDIVIQYYKVIDFNTDKKTGVVTLDVIEPGMSEVYDEFELCFNGGNDAVITQIDDKTLTENIRRSVLEDPSFEAYITKMIENTKKTPTVQKMLENVTEEERSEFLKVDAFTFKVGDVTITPVLSIEETEGGGAEIMLQITFDGITLKVGQYAEIGLTVNFSQNTTITPSGYTILFNKENQFRGNAAVKAYVEQNGLDEFIYEDSRMTNLSVTQFGFEATIKFTGETPKAIEGESPDNSSVEKTESSSLNLEASVDASSLGKTLIKEIQAVADSGSTDEYIEKVDDSNMFNQDLDYVEVAAIPLGKIAFNIGGAIDIVIDVNAKVSFGAQATLSANVMFSNQTLTMTRNVSIDEGKLNADRSNIYQCLVPIDKTSDFEKYKVRLFSKFDFDIMLKGKIGVRLGLAVSLGVSPTGLYEVIHVAITAEAGVYAELSGYVRYNGYILKNQADETTKKANVTGGICLEVGIYLSVSFDWKVLKWEGSLPITEKKWPLFSIGTDVKPIDFADKQDTVAFSSNGQANNPTTFNMFNASPLADEKDAKIFAIDYIDLMNGQSERRVATQQTDYEVSIMKDVQWVTTTDASGVHSSANFVPPYATKFLSIENGVITINSHIDGCPEAMEFDVMIELKGHNSLLDTTQPIRKIVKCIYLKNEIDVKNLKVFNVTFYDQNGKSMGEQAVILGFTPTEPSLMSWELDDANRSYEISADYTWIDTDGNGVNIGPMKDDSATEYYLNAQVQKKQINFHYTAYDENGDSYQAVTTVEALAPTPDGKYDGKIAPPDIDLPNKVVKDTEGNIVYSREFVHWEALGDESYYHFFNFETTPVVELVNTRNGSYLQTEQDFYALYLQRGVRTAFGSISYDYPKGVNNDYKVPALPGNSVPDEYFKAAYWMGQNINGEWIILYPGEKYDPFSDQYCDQFYSCDSRYADMVVYLDYNNKYVENKTVKNGDETRMDVGPTLPDVDVDGVNYRHTGWRVKVVDRSTSVIAITTQDGTQVWAHRLCYPIYTKYSGKDVTTVFDSGGWDMMDNAPAEYKGINFEITQEEYMNDAFVEEFMFEVPGLTDANGKELNFSWKSTTGNLYCKPGSGTYYRSITYRPHIRCKVIITGADQAYTYYGWYDEEFDIEQMKKDIPEVFTSLQDTHDYKVVDWKVPDGYKFGDTKDKNGYPVLSATFELKTVLIVAQYTATFDPNGGSFPDSPVTTHTGNFNTNIGFLEEPVKADDVDADGSKNEYAFLGWSTNKNATTADYCYSGAQLLFGQEVDKTGTPLREVTYYAIYRETKFHPITYSVGGGKFADGTVADKVFYVEHGQELPHNQNPALVADPTRADAGNTRYAFWGWESAAGNSHSFAPDTLSAKYTETPINCTVTYYSGAGTFSDGTTEKSKTVPYESELPSLTDIEAGLGNPTKASDETYTYEFREWSRSDYTMSDPVLGDTTLMAKYTKTYIEYTVTFDAGDGTYVSADVTGFALSGDNISKTYHYNDLSYYPPDPTPAAEEFFFAGWSSAIPNNVTQSVTYTAVYTSDESSVRTITFDATANGLFANGNQTIAFKGLANDDVYFNLEPYRAEYTFSGWNPDVTKFGTDDQVVYADYTSLNCKIMFDSNGGTFTTTEGPDRIFFIREGNNLYRDTLVGDFIAYPREPVPPTGKYFAGWDKVMVGVATESVTYTAVYVDNPLQVAAVTFIAESTFTFGESSIVVKGIVEEPILFERTPILYEDATYIYEFSGWAPAIGTSALPTTFADGYVYNAQYTATPLP